MEIPPKIKDSEASDSVLDFEEERKEGIETEVSNNEGETEVTIDTKRDKRKEEIISRKTEEILNKISQENLGRLLGSAERLGNLGESYENRGNLSGEQLNAFRESALYRKAFPLIKEITAETEKDIRREAKRKRNEDLKNAKEGDSQVETVWSSEDKEGFIRKNMDEEYRKKHKIENHRILTEYGKELSKEDQEKLKEKIGNDTSKVDNNIGLYISSKIDEIAERLLKGEDRNSKDFAEKKRDKMLEIYFLILYGKLKLKDVEEKVKTENDLQSLKEEKNEIMQNERKMVENKIRTKAEKRWDKMLKSAELDEETYVERAILDRAKTAQDKVGRLEMIEQGIEAREKKEKEIREQEIKNKKEKGKKRKNKKETLVVENEETEEKKLENIEEERRKKIDEVMQKVYFLNRAGGVLKEEDKALIEKELDSLELSKDILSLELSDEDLDKYESLGVTYRGEGFIEALKIEAKRNGIEADKDFSFEDRFYALLSKGYRPDKIGVNDLGFFSGEVAENLYEIRDSLLYAGGKAKNFFLKYSGLKWLEGFLKRNITDKHLWTENRVREISNVYKKVKNFIFTKDRFRQKTLIGKMKGGEEEILSDKEDDFLNDLVIKFKYENSKILKEKEDKNKNNQEETPNNVDTPQPEENEPSLNKPEVEKRGGADTSSSNSEIEENLESKNNDKEKRLKEIEAEYEEKIRKCKTERELYDIIKNLFKEKEFTDNLPEEFRNDLINSSNSLIGLIEDFIDPENDLYVGKVPVWGGIYKKAEELYKSNKRKIEDRKNKPEENKPSLDVLEEKERDGEKEESLEEIFNEKFNKCNNGMAIFQEIDSLYNDYKERIPSNLIAEYPKKEKLKSKLREALLEDDDKKFNKILEAIPEWAGLREKIKSLRKNKK